MSDDEQRLRDEFAKAALPGIIAGGGYDLPYNKAAAQAYEYADAMMVERLKS